MFNTEFTFNTSVGYGQNDGVQTVTDNQIKKLLEKNKNIVYKKTISINFNKNLLFEKNKIGLGDIVDFITKITGLKWLIIKITKGNCGCEKRRKLFNKWLSIPYLSVKIDDPLFYDPILIDGEDSYSKHKNRVINTQKTQPKKGCGCGRKKP